MVTTQKGTVAAFAPRTVTAYDPENWKCVVSTSDSILLWGLTSWCWSTSVSDSSWAFAGWVKLTNKVKKSPLPIPEEQESCSCSCFPQPPHSPGSKEVVKKTQFHQKFCVLYLFSYFIPELAVCHCIWAERQNIEKNCWYESGNFQSPQYFAISASLFSGPSHQVLSDLYFPISSNKVIERNIKDPTTMYDTEYEILHWETWPNLNHMLGIQKSSLYLIWKSWFLELKVR